MLTIKATKRDIKESLANIRGEGKVPAVFYGRKEESTPITISAIEFKKVWDEAGSSSVVTIEVDGESHDSLIHDVSVDPVKGHVLHTDFYVLEKGKKVEVETPLEFVGESPAEKAGHILVKVVYELEIKASAKDLPSEIEIDISSLTELGSQIHAKDIKLPEGVELMADPEEVIALIQEAQEEPEEPAEAPDLSTIEVEGEKKGDGEDASVEDSKSE